MSIREELKELVDKYYDAILRADFAEKEMDMQESVEALYEEEHIRKQLFDKIDEVVDINELFDLLKKAKQDNDDR